MQPFCLRRTSTQARTFQQTCRLASTRRKLVKPRTPSIYNRPELQRERPKDDDDDDDSIRWFEKDMETGTVRRIAGNPEEMEAKELRKKIKALEAELREYQSDTSDKGLMAGLEPEEKGMVQVALKKHRARQAELTRGLEVSLELPPLSVPLLKRLNTSLREAALQPDSVVRRKELWRWYCRAKYGVPALPAMLPQRAWQVLWETQTVESPSNPDRLLHIDQITSDLAASGLPLTLEQRHARVETLVALGKIDAAVQLWEQEYEAEDENNHASLQLGIKLFAETGDLERAHDVLQEYLKRHPHQDPRVILLLISANIKAGNDHMAFALYSVLRSKLESDMTMDDYDAITLSFLRADKKDLALGVFRDMMLQGNYALQRGNFSKEKQEELYKAMFDRMGALQSYSADVTNVNNVSLTAISALPHQWQNRFFYGSWLKKLIGMGQLDAASRVLELMYEREIEPDSKHVNGLIGAFMRSDDLALQERGETLGWSMIERRLEFTWRRRQRKRGETPTPAASVYKTEEGITIPPHVARPVPRATIETFNVLALHYLVKEKWAHVRHLHQTLRPAEINMDSCFMNHMLYAELYSGDHKSVWRQFVKYAKSTPPDTETYNCLWTGEVRHLDQLRNADRTGFPMPRQLFSVMSTWFSSMKSKQKKVAIEEFSTELYIKIIQSFCAERDFAACLAAMHGMAKLFGQYPDHDAARVVTTAVSNLPEYQVPTIRGRRGRQQMPVSQARLQNTGKVLSALANRRNTAALEHGVDITKLDAEARATENLNLLSEFIRVIMVRSTGNADAVEPLIEQASREIGTPGMDTGDIDASNVS
ncbi:hypothetical protein MBLNU459_g4621t1 [Dothideomycetes sp. NU459]